MSKLGIRCACDDDCRRFWEWANDPDTREGSFSPLPIPWETHVAWFADKMGAPDYYMYVVSTASDEPVAHVRFGLEGDRAVVSAVVGPTRRGKGYGAASVRLACATLFSATKTAVVDAYIRPENKKSVHVFTKAGFEEQGIFTVRGHPALHMTLHRAAVGC